MTTITLVSCVKTKLKKASRAEDLYISPLFKGARSYAESLGNPWYIMSALHGLVNPEEVISPYELTLKTMKKNEKIAWASKVFNQIITKHPDVKEVVILSGTAYYENLKPLLEDVDIKVHLPLGSMKLGERLSWFNKQRD